MEETELAADGEGQSGVDRRRGRANRKELKQSGAVQTGPDRRTEEGARSWLSLKAVGGRSKTGDGDGARS